MKKGMYRDDEAWLRLKKGAAMTKIKCTCNHQGHDEDPHLAPCPYAAMTDKPISQTERLNKLGLCECGYAAAVHKLSDCGRKTAIAYQSLWHSQYMNYPIEHKPISQQAARALLEAAKRVGDELYAAIAACEGEARYD